MKHFLVFGGLLLLTTSAFAGTCVPGSLQDYLNLGSDGCNLNSVQFFNFELGPLQNAATEIDPNSVQVTPGGGLYTPTLFFALNASAAAGQLLESIFRFNASADVLTSASISLGSPQVTLDGAVTGVLDVCAGGSFLGIEPVGCSGTPATAIAFAVDGDAELSASVGLPISSFFDVFTDISIDGGTSGSATLDSADVSVTTPEPATLLLMTAALGCLGIAKVRRGRRF